MKKGGKIALELTHIYIKCCFSLRFCRAKNAVGAEALAALRFLEIFTRVADIPRSYLEQYLSEIILDQYVFVVEVK